MKKLVVFFVFFTVLLSCSFNNNPNDKPVGSDNSELDKDTIGNYTLSALRDTGFIIKTSKYKLVLKIIRKYREIEIPINVCATFESNGSGQIDSLTFYYKGNFQNVRPRDYFVWSPDNLLVFMKENNQVRFTDYNFDNEPDIAIYNMASGVKNVMEDIYIYSDKYKRFLFNKILSNNSNCYADSVKKTISTFGQGGMASLIFGSTTYKWDDAKLQAIESVSQDFIDSLEVFVRKTSKLADSTWVTSIDTLTEEQAIEWKYRVGKGGFHP